LSVNALATALRYVEIMSDSLERLYDAVLAAKDLDPASSRTARLFQRGPAKMAKKLAEEAIEVVIDAVNGKPAAVIRESADLLYNLSVLWVAAGVRPQDVWDEMDRREREQGIAEKLPKVGRGGHDGSDKRPHEHPLAATKATAGQPILASAAVSGAAHTAKPAASARLGRRPIVARQTARPTKHR
jgi:phosphoribosyl-ATP pyrophosphohydrolase